MPREFSISPSDLYELSRLVAGKSGRLSLRTRGTSMHPFLKDGVKVTLAESDVYRIGDIVLGKSGRNVILHRVVKKLPYGMVTMGDARTGSSGDFMFSQDIVGKVVAVEGQWNPLMLQPPCGYLIARFAAPLVGAMQKNNLIMSIYRIVFPRKQGMQGRGV